MSNHPRHHRTRRGSRSAAVVTAAVTLLAAACSGTGESVVADTPTSQPQAASTTSTTAPVTSTSQAPASTEPATTEATTTEVTTTTTTTTTEVPEPTGDPEGTLTVIQDGQYTSSTTSAVDSQIVPAGEELQIETQLELVGPAIFNLFDSQGQRTTEWQLFCGPVDLISDGFSYAPSSAVVLYPLDEFPTAEDAFQAGRPPAATVVAPTTATLTGESGREHVPDCDTQLSAAASYVFDVPSDMSPGEYHVSVDHWLWTSWNEESNAGTYSFEYDSGEFPTVVVTAGG